MSAAFSAPSGCGRRARNSSPGPCRPRNCARSRTPASARSCSAQEDVGLKGITDGEFRRTYFHVDFLERLDGVETHYGEFVAKFRKDDGSEVGFKPPTMHVEGKIRHARPIQGPDFDFLKSVVTKTPKVCIPAPSMLHFRGGRQAISETRLSRPRAVLRRPHRRLSRRDRRSGGARLPLSAARRHQSRLSLRSEDPRQHARPRRRS